MSIVCFYCDVPHEWFLAKYTPSLQDKQLCAKLNHHDANQYIEIEKMCHQFQFTNKKQNSIDYENILLPLLLTTGIFGIGAYIFGTASVFALYAYDFVKMAPFIWIGWKVLYKPIIDYTDLEQNPKIAYLNNCCSLLERSLNHFASILPCIIKDEDKWQIEQTIFYFSSNLQKLKEQIQTQQTKIKNEITEFQSWSRTFRTECDIQRTKWEQESNQIKRDQILSRNKYQQEQYEKARQHQFKMALYRK